MSWKETGRDVKKCCFSDQEETIHRLCLTFSFPALIWRTILVAYNLPLPTSIMYLFANWLVGFTANLRDIFGREFVPYYGQFGTTGMTLFLTDQMLKIKITGYLQDYCMDPYVVITSACGCSWAHGLMCGCLETVSQELYNWVGSLLSNTLCGWQVM